MSKTTKQESNDDGIVMSSKEEKEKEDVVEEQRKEVDPDIQSFYNKYEELVKETGKVISPEMRYTHQGIYPVLTITDVPKETEENTAG